MESEERSVPHGRTCFVTIGATAAFNSLIAACLELNFLRTLIAHGYSRLIVQYGRDGKSIFESATSPESPVSQLGLSITGFAFNSQGLGQEMRSAKGEDGAPEGVVISHAGSGSILDALRIDVPLIVVPNPDLLDNHQVELAEALHKQGYIVHASLQNLPRAITESERLREMHKPGWPPVNSGESQYGNSFSCILDEEMGFID